MYDHKQMRYILQLHDTRRAQQAAVRTCTLSAPAVTNGAECAASGTCTTTITYNGGNASGNYYNYGWYKNQRDTMGQQGASGCGGDCGSGPCRFASYNSPKIVYFPIAVFTATKQVVAFTTNNVQGGVCAGSGDDQSFYRLVFIPWGNVYADRPDPNLINATTTEYNVWQGSTPYAIIPLNAKILAQLNYQYVNGHAWSPYVQNFDLSMRFPVQVGKTYAVALMAVLATDDKINVNWGPGTIVQSDV